MMVQKQKGHITVFFLTDNVPHYFDICEAPSGVSHLLFDQLY